MTRDELVTAILSDLQNEWQHLQYYLHHMNVFRGMHTITLRPLFEAEMRSEVEHVKMFSELIVQLGAAPVLENNGAPGVQFAGTNVREILQHAYQMEVDVAENYLQRIRQAEALGGVDGKLVQLFYEKQLEDSYTDAQKFKKILDGFES
jgi:bacterioferritin (cytochrome b1)